MQNFITLGQPLLGEKYVAQKKERKKNNPKNSGHFVPQQRLRAAHALGSDQLSTVKPLVSLQFPIEEEGNLAVPSTAIIKCLIYIIICVTVKRYTEQGRKVNAVCSLSPNFPLPYEDIFYISDIQQFIFIYC